MDNQSSWMSEPKKKNELFRQKIRREQIDNLFAQQRAMMLQRNQQSHSLELVALLNESADKQQQFLSKCSLSLTGEPQKEWLLVVQNLSTVTTAFNGQFQSWFRCSIIKMLTYAIKQSCFESKLTPAICSLFSDMVYLGWYNQTNFTQKLMEYEIVGDVIKQGLVKNYSLQDRLQMLRFCGNICQYSERYRNQILRLGGGAWLTDIGTQIITYYIGDQYAAHYFLLAARAFVQIPKKSSYEIPNLNIINKIIPIFSSFLLHLNSTDKILVDSLDILVDIFKYDRQAIYQSVFYFKGLAKRIVTLVVHQKFDVRYKSLHALCLLACTKAEKIPADLVEMGLLDQMYIACNLPASRENVGYNRVLVNALSNIADSTVKVTNLIFEHRIFEVVIAQLQNIQLKNKSAAFFCLNTIVQKLKFNSFYRLFNECDILNYLVLGLTEMQSVDSQTTQEIINCMTAIVIRSETIYQGNGNIVVEQLENKYNLTNILQGIQLNSKNQILLTAISELHQKMAAILWNHTPASL